MSEFPEFREIYLSFEIQLSNKNMTALGINETTLSKLNFKHISLYGHDDDEPVGIRITTPVSELDETIRLLVEDKPYIVTGKRLPTDNGSFVWFYAIMRSGTLTSVYTVLVYDSEDSMVHAKLRLAL